MSSSTGRVPACSSVFFGVRALVLGAFALGTVACGSEYGSEEADKAEVGSTSSLPTTAAQTTAGAAGSSARTADAPASPSSQVAADSVPASAEAPAAAAPKPEVTPKTVYVCPADSVPNGELCRRTAPYTFTMQPYTFHKEATGPAPILVSYETTIAACPAGYNYENYNWVAYCRMYGAAPTTDVKDATPAGFTDTGAEWMKRNAPPAGYTDDGTQWVFDMPKVAQVVAE